MTSLVHLAHTSKKIIDDLRETELKPTLVNQQNVVYEFKCDMCDANYKQLLDEVFVKSRIIKVVVKVISRSRRPRLITFTETLIILDITKTESNNCFIIH